MEFVPNPEPTPFGLAGDPIGVHQSTIAPVIESPVDTPIVGAAATEARSRPGAFRRMVATLALAVGLLIVGGVSAVWAASPDPSAATTPSTRTPSTTPGTTTHPKGNCPNVGGSSGGTNGSASNPSTSG